MEPLQNEQSQEQTQSPLIQAQVAPLTPPAQPFPQGVKYAGFWKRFAAGFIDGLIFGILSFVMSLFFGSTASEASSYGYSLSGIPALVFYLISSSYYVFFIGKYGQTLGKMAVHIKVLGVESGQPPGYKKAFMREIVGKFVSWIPLLLGYFWMIWDKNKQTWHDKIAKTQVVEV